MRDKEAAILSMQIDETVVLLGSAIRKTAIEKDLYVTKVIHAMSQVQHEYYRLVFQGGTCLAKAHKIIPRMSEDCDFRIARKASALTLSRTKARDALKDFRQEIMNRLQAVGFVLEDAQVHIKDEGRFVNMRLEYPSIYAKEVSALKPFLALDFFLII